MEFPDNLNFLLVEDLVSDSFLLQRQLKKISANPEIRFVDSEISLINALKTYIPDMVVTDFNLVGMDAFDVIRIIKEYNSKIPVVVISGHLKNEADSQRLLDAGSSGFLLKEPINTLNQRIMPVLKKVMEERHEQMETLGKERKKYASQKSQSDFLREHNFNTNISDLDQLVPQKGFWKDVRDFFGVTRKSS